MLAIPLSLIGCRQQAKQEDFSGNLTSQNALKQKANVHIEVRRASLTQHGYYVLHLQNTTQLKAIQQELENTQQTNSRLAHFDLLTLYLITDIFAVKPINVLMNKIGI